LTSGLAPESSTTVYPDGLGITEAMVGRSTPGTRPRTIAAAAMAAPVDPADTKPAAAPERTSRAHSTIDEFGFSRIAFAGSSPMATTSGASMMGDRLPGHRVAPAGPETSPTSTTSTPAAAAATAPATVSTGA
jgi:hypothetical protein